ncbi:hypothetical protein PANT_3c00036 [Moesziomyces antarcticus T-34]|uniref:Uncharacterized protein n=1 Tax=Pseudozyma antarctica (strain T-34) TaxID=1151754 RepID=M9MC65_PSEA3|nr:hypothetical protein PANT_3c00036 [Moesziomyces antarcticus T-34]
MRHRTSSARLWDGRSTQDTDRERKLAHPTFIVNGRRHHHGLGNQRKGNHPSGARTKTPVTPAPRYEPFLDVATRQASSDLAVRVPSSTSRAEIHLHPYRSDLLLGLQCRRGNRWSFFDIVTGDLLTEEPKTEPTVHPAEPTADVESAKHSKVTDNPAALHRFKCLCWASSSEDMQAYDPLYPGRGVDFSVTKSGAIQSLALAWNRLLVPLDMDRMHTNFVFVHAEDHIVERLQFACTSVYPLRVYYRRDDLEIPCRLSDGSIVNADVVFTGYWSIAAIQRHSEASIRLDLHRFQEPVELDDLASKLEPAFNGSANIHLESSEHTFGAFRCRSCGMANQVSVSRPRKMELCFSGSRSDLGHANMLLTNDDLPLRLTSSFDTGARICSYHLATPSEAPNSLPHDKARERSDAVLHHIVNPGRPGQGGLETLSHSLTLFKRMSRNVEAKVHLRAFALCFGSTKRGACHEIATDLLPVSSLPMDLMPLIVHIRESLQLVGAHRERLLRPAGCLFLLLEKGRLKVDSTFFPDTSAHFGLLVTGSDTNVSLRRSTLPYCRQAKDVSLGSFVMKAQDTLVAPVDVLRTAELQLKTSLLAPRRLRLHLCHRPTKRLYDEHMWSDPDFIEAFDRMEAAVAQAAAPEAVVAQAAHDSAPFLPLDKMRLTLAPRQADEDWFTKPADMVDFVFFRPCFRSDGVQRSAKLHMRINVTSLAGLHNKAFRQRRLGGKPEANFIGRVAEICLLAPLQRQDKNSRNHWIYLVDANGQHRVTT